MTAAVISFIRNSVVICVLHYIVYWCMNKLLNRMYNVGSIVREVLKPDFVLTYPLLLLLILNLFSMYMLYVWQLSDHLFHKLGVYKNGYFSCLMLIVSESCIFYHWLLTFELILQAPLGLLLYCQFSLLVMLL